MRLRPVDKCVRKAGIIGTRSRIIALDRNTAVVPALMVTAGIAGFDIHPIGRQQQKTIVFGQLPPFLQTTRMPAENLAHTARAAVKHHEQCRRFLQAGGNVVTKIACQAIMLQAGLMPAR